MCFPCLSPRNVTHVVQDVRMFQAVDKSTDLLAIYALNQQMKMHRGRPERCRLVTLSNILKGSETSLNIHLSSSRLCWTALFVTATTRCETLKIPVLVTRLLNSWLWRHKIGVGQLLHEIFSHYSIALFSLGREVQYLILLLDLVFHNKVLKISKIFVSACHRVWSRLASSVLLLVMKYSHITGVYLSNLRWDIMVLAVPSGSLLISCFQ